MEWTLEKRKIADLKPLSKNPRKLSKHDYEHLKKSLDKFGLIDKPIINTDGTIIGGHQRVAVLKRDKVKEVECYVAQEPLSERDLHELNVRLNRNAGEWDFDILANEWDEADLLEWGFTDSELSLDILDESAEEESGVPEAPKAPLTKLGDLYELGDHRLICGDCRHKEMLAKLFKEARVDCLMTDPPYGVDYANKNEMLNRLKKGNRIQTPIQNDEIDDYRSFFREFLEIIPWSNKNTFYIAMSGVQLHNLRMAIDDCDLKWGDYLVWVKNNHVLGRKDYNAKHEFFVYGWHDTHEFYGPHRTTVLEFDKPTKNDLHPTMKPIPLIAQLIADGSADGANIYDPFLGSGTTLIACEQLKRKCFGIEIAPEYCDVIVKRWVNYRKQQQQLAVVKRNGKLCKDFDAPA